MSLRAIKYMLDWLPRVEKLKIVPKTNIPCIGFVDLSKFNPLYLKLSSIDADISHMTRLRWCDVNVFALLSKNYDKINHISLTESRFLKDKVSIDANLHKFHCFHIKFSNPIILENLFSFHNNFHCTYTGTSDLSIPKLQVKCLVLECINNVKVNLENVHAPKIIVVSSNKIDIKYKNNIYGLVEKSIKGIEKSTGKEITLRRSILRRLP